MSKLASTLTQKGREALESFVAAGDTSVPGIEPSDLNDGDILARTRENVNPNGQFQFVYIPEDGSDPVTSDWIAQEHKKKVTLSWIEGVKSAIIGRGQQAMREANEAAAEKRLKALQQEDMEAASEPVNVDQTVGRGNRKGIKAAATTGRIAAADAETNQGAAVQVSSQDDDPSDYVEDQLGMARERLRVAEEMQNEVLREVISARKAVSKWQALASALDGSESVGDVADVPDGVPSSPSINVSVAKPRAANVNSGQKKAPVKGLNSILLV